MLFDQSPVIHNRNDAFWDQCKFYMAATGTAISGGTWYDIITNQRFIRTFGGGGATVATDGGRSLCGNAYSIRFAGSNSSFFKIVGDPTRFFNATAISLMAWIMPDVVSGNKPFFGFRSVGDTVVCYLYSSGTNFRFRLRTDAATAEASDTTRPLAANRWTHVVGTWDGTTIRTYIDGVAGSTNALTGNLLTPTNFGIGFPLNNIDFYDGSIAQCGMWSRVLNPTEIYNHYLAGRHGDTAYIGEVNQPFLAGVEIANIMKRRYGYVRPKTPDPELEW